MTPKDPLAGLSPDESLTIKEAATRLGVSERMIRKAIKDGYLKAWIPGRTGPDAGLKSGRSKYRIIPAELRKWFFGK
jgi:excisionase family DNA binding protein